MKNHLIQKFALLATVISLIGCSTSSYRAGGSYDYKNPLESYTGLINPEITDSGLLKLLKGNVEVLSELWNGKDTGKKSIVRSPNNSSLDIELNFSENPELNRVISTGAGVEFNLNIEKELSKARKESRISVKCLNCTKLNMPRMLDYSKSLYSEFEFRKTVGEYRAEIAERKRQDVISKREYAKLQELQNKQNQENLKKAQIEEARLAKKIAIEGDGSSDDLTCKSFGFKPQASGYSDCRLKLEVASRQATQQQAQYEEQKRQYDEQKRQHDAQLAEQKRQRQVGAGLALMQMGSGLLAPPAPPPPANQTIVTPSGRIVNCHTTGTVTNCF
jgi:hypothetical protein